MLGQCAEPCKPGAAVAEALATGPVSGCSRAGSLVAIAVRRPLPFSAVLLSSLNGVNGS